MRTTLALAATTLTLAIVACGDRITGPGAGDFDESTPADLSTVGEGAALGESTASTSP